MRAGRLAQAGCEALLKVARNLLPNVLLEAADDEAFVPKVLWRVVVRVADRRGIEEAHQRSEAASGAVVGCGREQHKGVGTRGEHPSQPRTAREALFSCARQRSDTRR